MKFTDLHTRLPHYCYSVFTDKYTKLRIELSTLFVLSSTDVLRAFGAGHNLRFLSDCSSNSVLSICSVIFQGIAQCLKQNEA